MRQSFRNLTVILVLSLPMIVHAEQKLTFGRYNARAIFNEAPASACPAPLVIMQTGSGANGPEEMVPGALTLDGKDHSLFAQFSEGLRRGNVGTLAIGKPGIDFFKSFDPKEIFYDQSMFTGLTWQGLLDNMFDAVTLAKTLPCVDSKRIYFFGHSEGTQAAVDFAKQYPQEVKGLLLAGYSGEPLAETVDWQLFRRSTDVFLEPDVDKNKDRAISFEEAQSWPEFSWPWSADKSPATFVEIEAMLRADSHLQAVVKSFSSVVLWKEIFNRAPIYKETAELPQDIFIFTGSDDIQTRPEEALLAEQQCKKIQKANCEVQIVSGLGHGFSAPKGPRKHKLLDATLGPVDESFKAILQSTASQF